MSSILYEREFARLEGSIHASTYKLFKHMALLDLRIDNGMAELSLRRRATMKAWKDIRDTHMGNSEGDEPRVEIHSSETHAGNDLSTLIQLAVQCLRALHVSRYMAALTCALLLTPVAAMDHQMVLGTAVPILDAAHVPWTGMLFLCAGCLLGAARNLVGPLMGITSVLYFMMRNDAAIPPSLAWTVLGAWSGFALTYFTLQCRRIFYNRIYVLLSLGFAGIGLCVVALVQKSSIQGGLVTAIPPCTSFAAYAVAFAFPDRKVCVEGCVMV